MSITLRGVVPVMTLPLKDESIHEVAVRRQVDFAIEAAPQAHRVSSPRFTSRPTLSVTASPSSCGANCRPRARLREYGIRIR